jgi:hypothetical protein
VEIDSELAQKLHDELSKEHSTTGLGDLVHKIAGPIGKKIHWPCNERDAEGHPTTELRANSPCAKARAALNKISL